MKVPTKITFGITGSIVYIYNALGQKVEKQVFTSNQGSIPVIHYYLNGFQYGFRENYAYYVTKLQFVPTAEGYYDFIKTKYVFSYTDHLGNVRLSYAKNPTTDVLEIIEESNYYPFGLKHKGYNGNNSQLGYKYKFNGKELQDELGLNMYDYGARNYDPALGRWMNIDPLAEKSRRFSPYTYALNNPVFFIDPDGMLSQSFIDDLWNKSGSGETKWTNNNDGSFSGGNGATADSGEGGKEGSESNSNGPGDPPTTSSISDFFKSLFNMTPKSEEEAEQSNTDRDFFTKATDLMIEVGDSYQTAMMLIFPLPSNPSSEIKATGWIARKVFNSLDSSVAKKFAAAISKGVVAPSGKQGIIKLTASEAKAVGGEYTYKLKILGKGGDLRIYGKQLPNGHFVFDKVLTH